MKTEIIYFVHGTTYDNASGKCSGWKQVELNDLGKQQAKNLGEITKDLIDRMTDEIYMNFEAEERPTQNNMRTSSLKNGDVRNPNAKEPEVRQSPSGRNFLLRDLIRILILRELGRPNRPQFPPPGRPPMPPPRPPMGPGGNRPPWGPY